MTQKQITEKEQLKAEAKAKQDADAAEETALNAGRKGKGLRVTIGYTRGRSTQRIQYEAFDTDQPETLPANLTELQEITGVSDEALLTSWAIDGFNSYQYANASDPITEHVNPAWPAETKSRFKLAVRNFSNGAELSIDDAVIMVKPAFEAAFAKATAAK